MHMVVRAWPAMNSALVDKAEAFDRCATAESFARGRSLGKG
jgi:hypothetical protein